jgi:hypothetical protein
MKADRSPRTALALVISAGLGYMLAQTLAPAGVFSWPVLDDIPASGVTQSSY